MKDIIIRGGTIYDGTGAPGVRADLAIEDGKITAIGDLSGEQAAEELDAAGLAVAPGFINIHGHSDTAFLLDDSFASLVYQGVTTEVCGNCGYTGFPALPPQEDGIKRAKAEGWYCASFDDFAEKFEREGRRMGANLAYLAAHGSIRSAAAGYDDRPVTKEELRTMQELLRRDLKAGAWGMSLGLEYAPGCFADEDELAAMGEVVQEFDALLPAHLRNEGVRLGEAIDELLSVGRRTGAHVHISHLKLDNVKVHGTAPQIWEKIEKAKAEGVRVTADMYPYLASHTGLTNRCPKWALSGGDGAIADVLTGPRREEVISFIREKYYWNAERAETAFFTDGCERWPEVLGKNLREVAEELLGTTDYAEAAAEILVRTKGEATGCFFVMSEADMLYFLKQDICLCTDGYAYPVDPAKLENIPHPRSYGAIAEFLRLNRELGICSVEEAVRRLTGKPAEILGMKDRGLLKPGLTADVTVFDPAAVRPAATYLHPVAAAEGVRHVVIGGGIALRDGVQTEGRYGTILRRQV